jgi:FAD/FMN-containing dehydrogenases
VRALFTYYSLEASARGLFENTFRGKAFDMTLCTCMDIHEPKVKGGGHATNPGFSSSPGVLISMSRFNVVTYDATTKTATVGAGSIWDAVHLALEKYGVTVVGGRTGGVGVAGFTLGGGGSASSHISNLYFTLP